MQGLLKLPKSNSIINVGLVVSVTHAPRGNGWILHFIDNSAVLIFQEDKDYLDEITRRYSNDTIRTPNEDHRIM